MTAQRRRRWPWIVGGGILTASLAFLFLVPWIAGAVARSRLAAACTAAGYRLVGGRFSFGWRQGLVVEHLTVTGPGVRLTLQRLRARPRWHRLLYGELGFRPVTCLRPELAVDPAARPPRPPPRPSAAPPAGGGRALPPPEDRRVQVTLPLRVREGRVRVRLGAGRADLVLADLTADLIFQGPAARLSFRVAGRLRRGDAVGELHLEGGLDYADKPTGSARLTADLRPLRGLLPGGAAAGELTVDVRLDTPAGDPRLQTVAAMRDLALPGGEVEREVRLEGVGVLALARRGFRLEGLRLRSSRLDADAAGVVGRERTALTLALRSSLGAWTPWFPPDLSVTGGVKGQFDLTVGREGTALRGELAAQPFRWRRGRMELEDPSLLLKVQGRLRGKEAGGEVRLTGRTLQLTGKLASPALPALTATGTLAGKSTALLAALGTTLPAGLAVEGPVGLRYRLQVDRPSAGPAAWRLHLEGTGPAAANRDLRVGPVELAAAVTPEGITLRRLAATVNGGRVTLAGRVEKERFRLTGELTDVGITETLRRLLAPAVPLYHLPAGADAVVGGEVSGTFRLAGPLPLERAETLAGAGTLRIREGYVEGSPLLAQLLGALGRRARYRFAAVSARFRLAKGWVVHEELRVKGRELAWALRGRTSLDGRIEYRVPAGPLVARIYRRRLGSARRWGRVLGGLLRELHNLPVAVTGTLDRPRLRLDPQALHRLLPGMPKALEGLLRGRRKEED